MIGVDEERLRAMGRVERGDEDEGTALGDTVSESSRATAGAVEIGAGSRATVHLAAIANPGDVRRAPVFGLTLCGLDAARAVVLDLSAPAACAACLSERDRGAEFSPPRYGACFLQPVMVTS